MRQGEVVGTSPLARTAEEKAGFFTVKRLFTMTAPPVIRDKRVTSLPSRPTQNQVYYFDSQQLTYREPR